MKKMLTVVVLAALSAACGSDSNPVGASDVAKVPQVGKAAQVGKVPAAPVAKAPYVPKIERCTAASGRVCKS
jgi:hypothetical protein